MVQKIFSILSSRFIKSTFKLYLKPLRKMKALRKVKLHPRLKFKVLLKKIASAVSLTSLNPLKKLNGSKYFLIFYHKKTPADYKDLPDFILL